MLMEIYIYLHVDNYLINPLYVQIMNIQIHDTRAKKVLLLNTIYNTI